MLIVDFEGGKVIHTTDQDSPSGFLFVEVQSISAKGGIGSFKPNQKIEGPATTVHTVLISAKPLSRFGPELEVLFDKAVDVPTGLDNSLTLSIIDKIDITGC